MKPARDPESAAPRIQRLLLAHLWACAPFGILWALWPHVLGRAELPSVVFGLRVLYAVVGVSLAARTVIAWRRPDWAWTWYVWPIVDVAQITAAILIAQPKPDSWVILLYALPVIQAGATLNLRWALFVAVLSAAACGAAQGFMELQYAYFAFRLFMLVLIGSLFTLLAQELSRSREALALLHYRNELAAEMHDGLQQYLGAMAMRLDSASRQENRGANELARVAGQQADIARQAADELRLMVWRLRSRSLDVQGMIETLERQLALYRDRTGSSAELVIEGKPRALEPRREHALLRIVQEALTNAAKHAEAAKATVYLRFGAESVECEVADDGRGFDSGEVSADGTGGLGLESMKTRAETVGCTFGIESAPGKGTRVRVEIPLDALRG